MKAVLDANVIISALRFGGKPRQIFELSNSGEIEGYTSSVAMQEIEAVFRLKFKLSRIEWQLFEEVIKGCIGVVQVDEELVVPGLRDIRDSHLLEAASSIGADCTISGDKDLLVFGSHGGIPIMDAHKALLFLQDL